jgi:hypothetical protein
MNYFLIDLTRKTKISRMERKKLNLITHYFLNRRPKAAFFRRSNFSIRKQKLIPNLWIIGERVYSLMEIFKQTIFMKTLLRKNN